MKKIRSLSLFVAFCIAMIIIFTVAAIAFQAVTGQTLPDSLIMGVFGFFGTELAATCVIKVFKLREE